jgi:hypothetical protein
MGRRSFSPEFKLEAVKLVRCNPLVFQDHPEVEG